MMEAVAGFALLLIIAGSLVRRAQRKTAMQDEQVRQMLRSTSGRTPPGAVIPYTYGSKSASKRITTMQAARQRDDWKRRDVDPVFLPSVYSMGLDMAKSPDVSPDYSANFAGGESGGAGGGSSFDSPSDCGSSFDSGGSCDAGGGE